MRVYLISVGLARLADEMVGLALVLFVLARTDDLALAGATVAAYTVPSIVSGPLLGAWLDRTRRPLVALVGNQFLLAATAVALLAVVGHAPAVVVLVLALLAGITLPMTSGGFTSLLPRLATDLPKATAADALLFNAAALGGPALTGVLAAVFGVDSAVVAIGVLALVAGLCTLGLRVPPHEATEHPSLRQAMHDGVRHLATTPPLRGATLATMLGHGAIGLLATALPVHVTELGHPEGAAGFVWAAMEVGCVVSLLSLRRHLPRWRPEHVVFATVAASGLALATWPLAPNFGVLLALGLLVGAAQGPTLTSIITTRQRYTPSTLLGQVSTTGASLKIGAFAVGAAVGGGLHDTSAVFLAAAATQVIAAGLGFAWSRRVTSARRPGSLVREQPHEEDAMPFEEAVATADEATIRSMVAADPGLRGRHADLVARMAEARDWSAVRLLVDLGFGVDGVTAGGATALHHAAAAGDLSIARLLVEHGADHTAREPGFKARPAGWAQYFKKPELQEYLESLA